jgi:hypothetical protein
VRLRLFARLAAGKRAPAREAPEAERVRRQRRRAGRTRFADDGGLSVQRVDDLSDPGRRAGLAAPAPGAVLHAPWGDRVRRPGVVVARERERATLAAAAS